MDGSSFLLQTHKWTKVVYSRLELKVQLQQKKLAQSKVLFENQSNSEHYLRSMDIAQA